MFEPALGLARVEVQQHANTARETSGDRHFGGAEEWDFGPAETTRGAGGVFGRQVGRRREDRALDVGGLEAVGVAQRGEQLLGRFENRFARIRGCRGRSAQTA